MTFQDFLDFMDHLQEHQFRDKGAEHRKKVIPLIFWILLYTGMRPQEVLALGPDDIDLEKNVIHIRHSVEALRRNTDRSFERRHQNLSGTFRLWNR